jgi:hypothetical protein
LKSGSLNFLEPSGPVKGCNGMASPLPLYLKIIAIMKIDFVVVTNVTK